MKETKVEKEHFFIWEKMFRDLHFLLLFDVFDDELNLLVLSSHRVLFSSVRPWACFFEDGFRNVGHFSRAILA